MKYIITNNEKVRDRFENTLPVEFVEDHSTYETLLYVIRDKVHAGDKLLTHPLSGSVKPNETPFKSVIMEKGNSLDNQSLSIIEAAIATMKKFQSMEKTPQWTEKVMDDFRVVDLDIMTNTIERLNRF